MKGNFKHDEKIGKIDFAIKPGQDQGRYRQCRRQSIDLATRNIRIERAAKNAPSASQKKEMRIWLSDLLAERVGIDVLI